MSCISACTEKARIGIEHGWCAHCSREREAQWQAEITQLRQQLSAMEQERDDWRLSFETANEAIGTMHDSAEQATREGFEAGFVRGVSAGCLHASTTAEEAWALDQQQRAARSEEPTR